MQIMSGLTTEGPGGQTLGSDLLNPSEAEQRWHSGGKGLSVGGGARGGGDGEGGGGEG